jgi:pimeloyl-ACP methyl ester carboxylesterase
MIPHQTGSCASGDVTLHYRRFGAAGKTPFVILHGLSFFSYDWIPVGAALAADREVAAMDMRGFGDSTWSPSQDYSIPTMAKDIVALADHLGWSRFAIFGHSMGGRSGVWCAAGNPDRVTGLLLGDFTPENAPAGSQRTAKTVAGTPDLFASVDAAMKHFGAPASRRERFAAYLQQVEGGFRVKRDTHFRDQFRRSLETGEKPAMGVDLWDAISRIRCPLKVIRGTRSDLFGPESIAKYHEKNPRAVVVEIDAGHNIGADNPDAVIGEAREFLAST